MRDCTTLRPSNGTSALVLLPLHVDSVGPRAHAHLGPIPTPSIVDHALETKTPEVLAPEAPGPFAGPVWLLSSSQGWAKLRVCLLLEKGHLHEYRWCLHIQPGYPYTHMSRRTEPQVERKGKWAGFWECFLCCDMVMWNSEEFEKFKSIPSFAGSYKGIFVKRGE